MCMHECAGCEAVFKGGTVPPWWNMPALFYVMCNGGCHRLASCARSDYTAKARRLAAIAC